MISFGGCLQILLSISYSFKEVELLFGVFPLVLGCLQEYPSNLFETLLLSYCSKVGIFVTCLRFAGKGGKKILFGFASLEFHPLLL